MHGTDSKPTCRLTSGSIMFQVVSIVLNNDNCLNQTELLVNHQLSFKVTPKWTWTMIHNHYTIKKNRSWLILQMKNFGCLTKTWWYVACTLIVVQDEIHILFLILRQSKSLICFKNCLVVQSQILIVWKEQMAFWTLNIQSSLIVNYSEIKKKKTKDNKIKQTNKQTNKQNFVHTSIYSKVTYCAATQKGFIQQFQYNGSHGRYDIIHRCV